MITVRPSMSVIVWVVGVVVVVVGEVVVDVDVLLEVHPLRVVARMVRAINSEATVRRYFFMQTPFPECTTRLIRPAVFLQARAD